GAPAGAPGGDAGGNNGVAAGVGTQVGGMGGRVDNGEYAMVAGCVAIDTGARGRDNQASDGTYYGKAPAAIVDLKSAVRYLRANKDNGIPGNTERIVCTGSSAGGALTALLGASGDSSLYDSYLKEVGAADASDSIYAAAPYCPITDLEHADAGYEWVLGKVSSQKVTVDQTVSDALAALFPAYFNSLNIKNVTADNLADYILSEHIVPSAEAYLQGLSDSDRTTYLQNNPWITYNNGKVSFSWSDYTEHIGRSKSAPAFDAFDLSAPENKEFGSKTVSARHFSDYSAQHENTTVEQEVKDLLPLMNPVHFLSDKNPNRAKHWFMRVGTSDTDTSPAVLTILAALAQQAGDNVDVDYYWDQGHGTNIDPEKFAAWVKSLA
ncbi:MAG: subtype B tannase, partial [Corynebacterium sp.]|nr:subtype B tannase [Corynebacterium sp.]